MAHQTSSLIIKVIRKLAEKVRGFYEYLMYKKYFVNSYAHEGEDVLLHKIFGKKKGFYVDVGAHHPMRFSNTFLLHKQGWKGINIEPNPDLFKLFEKYRPNDINVNLGVANVQSTLKYLMFNEPALNTFDNELAESRVRDSNYKLINSMSIEVKPLAGVLKEKLPDNITINFLTIDVEGLDLEVLRSNDWKQFRPDWVLVEQLNLENIEDLDFEVHHYMKSVNYVLFAKTYNTLFYKEKCFILD
jgi:FkbM family methyltransferase